MQLIKLLNCRVVYLVTRQTLNLETLGSIPSPAAN